MKSGVPWQVSGVRREARETAREAARRAGISIGEWLDTVILDSAEHDEPGPRRHGVRESGHDEESGRDEETRDDEAHLGRSRYGEEGLEERLPPARSDDPSAMRRGFSELHQRLDDLTQQLGQVASGSKAPPAASRAEPSPQLVHVLSKLDRRLDQLIAEERSSRTEIERRVNALGAAVTDLQREPARTTTTSTEPATPLDQALREIADRQRTLDGYAPAGPTAAPTLSEGLPRARTQDFSGLEQQLRQVNAQIEKLKPCGVDTAVETLRDDLAEIGAMLQDALPRKSVEAIEQEIRKLTERIDQSRDAGADAGGLANVERGLEEVRDALRGLTPANDLPGIDRELQHLSQKVDGLAHNSQDPAALRQLEDAILSLRGIVSQTASNDALASLSDEVRVLSDKVDRATAGSGNDSILNALEERIAALADGLAARNEHGHSVPRELEAVINGLADKIERVQLSSADHSALGHLEDRIARLVEKLDASDTRLNQLEAIERGLAELLIHLEHQRVPNISRAESSTGEVDELARDVADLRNTGKKTQESLELAHGTLGHVVDRLAMLETDMRVRPAHPADTPLTGSYAASPAAAKPGPRPNGAAETGRNKASKPESPKTIASSASRPSSPPPAEARHAIEFDLAEPAGLNETLRPEHQPIDPTLPPDHPLEPGSGGSRRTHPGSPADRIAASEAALAGAKAPDVMEASGKPDFIAAARRAAQAAGRATPSKSTDPKERASAVGKLASRVGKLRALIGGTTGVLILLGGLQIAKNFLGSPPNTEATSSSAESYAVVPAPKRSAEIPALPEVKPPAPAANEQDAPTASEPPADRQSSALPRGASALPSSAEPARQAIEPLPTTSTRSAVPAVETTGSIPAAAQAAATTPSPVSTPAMSIPAPTQPGKPPSAADKLPPAFGAALRAAAAKGDASAQYEIGQRYAEGRGVAQNLTEAAEWFERAAKHGLAPAQFRLGGLYEKGLGVKKNLDTARRLYMAAGEAGNAKALHNLAVLYAEGVDGKPDYQTAARWFGKAAAYGVPDSQYNLAVLYARGIGVEQNLTEAYRWFALAARGGDADSAKKRDDLAIRLDRNALNAVAQAIETWVPQQQPAAAIEVKAPADGLEEATSPPAPPTKRKSLMVGPKLDLATPRVGQ